MDQLVQVVGALLILVAYVLTQFGVLDQRSLPYLVCNVLGAATLTVLAYLERQWGFFLLEAVWTAVTIRSLLVRSHRVQGTRHPTL